MDRINIKYILRIFIMYIIDGSVLVFHSNVGPPTKKKKEDVYLRQMHTVITYIFHTKNFAEHFVSAFAKRAVKKERQAACEFMPNVSVCFYNIVSIEK